MSVEENKALYREWIEEGYNSRDIAKGQAAVDHLFSSDYVDHGVPPGFPRTVEAPKREVAMYLTAFPDLHVTVEHLVGDGDLVVGHIRIEGTQAGEFHGVAPTGKHVSFTAFDMVRITNGKIVEHWITAEFLGLLRQLGAKP